MRCIAARQHDRSAPPRHGVQAVTGTFSVETDGEVEEELLPVAINVDGLRLEQPGIHRFVIAVDGAEVRELPFAVALRED